MEEPKEQDATEATAVKKRDPRADTILESLRQGGSIIASCQGAGIHPATFWRWRQVDKDLDTETEAAIFSRVMIVEDALYSACIKLNPTAIMFFLMNQAGHKWKDRRAVPNLSASATANAEAEVGNAAAARKRIARNMRIIQELGLGSESVGQG